MAAAGQIVLSAADGGTAAGPTARPAGGGGARLLRSQPALDDVPRSCHSSRPRSTRRGCCHRRSGITCSPGRPSPSTARSPSPSCSSPARTRCRTRPGPSAVADALDDVVRNVQAACADHDVTFFETDINRDGGKIMLTAGAPRSADHDEERMLRVARQVLDRAGAAGAADRGQPRPVFAGDFGPAFRRTYSVKGDAVNLAARVMAKAAPGQLLATAAVVDRSRTIVPHGRAGRPSWSRASRCLSGRPRSARFSAPGVEERMAVPLIGREPEMAALGAALDDVRARHGRLVQIVGEPGIGKSRLVEELLAGRARRTRGASARRGVRVVDGVLPVPAAAARRTGPGRRGRARRCDSPAGRPGGGQRAAPAATGCPCWASRWTSSWSRPSHSRARRAVPQGPARGRRQRVPVLRAPYLDRARLRGRAPDGRRGRGTVAAARGGRSTAVRGCCWSPAATRGAASCRRLVRALVTVSPGPAGGGRGASAGPDGARRPPAAPAGAGHPGRAQRRQPDVPGGTRPAKPAGQGRWPTCQSRWKALSPARSTASTLPTARCCAMPRFLARWSTRSP